MNNKQPSVFVIVTDTKNIVTPIIKKFSETLTDTNVYLRKI